MKSDEEYDKIGEAFYECMNAFALKYKLLHAEMLSLFCTITLSTFEKAELRVDEAKKILDDFTKIVVKRLSDGSKDKGRCGRI